MVKCYSLIQMYCNQDESNVVYSYRDNMIDAFMGTLQNLERRNQYVSPL